MIFRRNRNKVKLLEGKKKMKLLKKLLVVCAILPLYSHANEAQLLIDHVKLCIEQADAGKSNLTQDILNIDGLSSSKVRHLLNNLCTLPNARYLEIGVYRGSTFISALYNNTNNLLDAIAIDNWSEYGCQKDIFYNNCIHYLKENSFRFHEQDSFTVNLKELFNQPINIYFYDGNHSFDCQRQAFTYYNSILSDTFIALVDDWNVSWVREGTRKGFEELGYTILFEQELPAYYVGDVDNWWNGLYIAVIQK